jgi:dTDP-4-amino-4,6-dideoxygalactose transaminase
MGDNFDQNYAMTAKAATLLLSRWDERAEEATHHRKIAEIYKNTLPKSIQFEQNPESKSLYLRFPIKIEKRTELVAHLKQKGVHIGDTWYDAPVGPKRYLAQTNYQTGQCPNAEKLSATIINLPTHINISEVEAQSLAEEVSKWLQ